MFYEDLKKLRPVEFKRYCGVKPKTFAHMVAVVSGHQEKIRRKSGRPSKLSVADQIVLTLEYWREYRTFFHLGTSWGLHESSVCRIVQRVEMILTTSKAFALPGKKRLQQADHTLETVVVDASETPLERPRKKQRRYYSGKKKRHTLKSQVVIDKCTKQIICTAHCRGAQHDFALYKQSGVQPEADITCLGDRGYQGLNKLHSNSQTPEKKPRGQKLAAEAKRRNRALARLRIVVEHVIRHLKIFRILAERYRNRRRRFSLRFNLIAGLFNFELNLN
jgi:hypothetical protein